MAIQAEIVQSINDRLTGTMKKALTILFVFAFSVSCMLSNAFAATAAAVPVEAGIQEVPSTTGDVSLNQSWTYYESAVEDPALLDPGQPATSIDLPHTWNTMDPTDTVPGYRRDASWYRKQLNIAAGGKPKRYLLYFEAANMTADVYVNGERAGGHVGGYLGFEIDITDYVDLNGVNDILVRVDNGVNRHLIPSQKSDFVLYGGLVRDVFLRIRPPDYIRSTRITTPRVSAQSAEIAATVRIARSGAFPLQLVLEVKSPDAETVASASIEIEPGPGPFEARLNLPDVVNPQLWSPGSPSLYALHTTLQDRRGKVLHSSADRFGFRWFGFNEKGAFELNGERLLLRGTHRHEEFAGYGEAMPNELHALDMQMIKELGANFVRLAHYPQDPVVYEAADELGLIVWDELPWCRGGIGDQAWKNNTEAMLREMISQNFNHPSIMFWSLGNEIYWEPDFEDGGNESKLNEYLQHLNNIAHQMDPGRLTSIRKYYAGADIVDVFSPSIWAGWYGGGFHQYEAALKDARNKYPAMLHMEYGGSSHVGRSNDNPPGGDGLQGGQASVEEMVNQSGVISVAKGGDWSESYIVDLFDWHLKVSESLENFAGNAQWAFKDFSTPLRPENPLPFVNQKGLVDRQGRPKEAYWVFKSYWTTDPAFCHIYGHSWIDRHGAKDSTQRIRVYCNTESAQLSLNDVSLDEKIKDPEVFPASGLFWDVKLEEGLNRLDVIGRSNGEAVAEDRLEIHYSEKNYGKPVNIELKARSRADGLISIEATAVDKNGLRVHSSSERVYFSHTNPSNGGTLLGAYGTPDKSSVIELSNGRATILFEPSDDGGTAVIEVRSQTFKGSYIRLPEALSPKEEP